MIRLTTDVRRLNRDDAKKVSKKNMIILRWFLTFEEDTKFYFKNFPSKKILFTQREKSHF